MSTQPQSSSLGEMPQSASRASTINPWLGLWLLGGLALFPHIVGSAFNITYNLVVVEPLLLRGAQYEHFINTTIVLNSIVFPLGIGVWIWLLVGLRGPLQVILACRAGNDPDEADEDVLRRGRARLINLPWYNALIAGLCWFSCIPGFLLSLSFGPGQIDPHLYWHLPTSFTVSGLIAVTHAFFVIEIASILFFLPLFFRGERPDRVPGAWPVSLRGRGVLWTLAATVCPIASMTLILLTPDAEHLRSLTWFAMIVGVIGIAFAVTSTIMMDRLVASPVAELTAAAKQIGAGQLGARVQSIRTDDLGVLIHEFNAMAEGLREKEQLRETFGMHVGQKAATHILARDPGLSGVEQVITIMFVDIRGFTARCADTDPQQAVQLLNRFLGVMVDVVEESHNGMINKFLGDGFMAVFGAIDSGDPSGPARDALAAGCDILRMLDDLNGQLPAEMEPLRIGVGIHTGAAIVGIIGAPPRRLEFTTVGNAVNIASRVESLTKEAGSPLLLTEATRQLLPDDAPVEPIPARDVRGLKEKLALYRWKSAKG